MVGERTYRWYSKYSKLKTWTLLSVLELRMCNTALLDYLNRPAGGGFTNLGLPSKD